MNFVCNKGFVMKKMTLISALSVLTLAFSSFAFAKPHGDDGDKDNGRDGRSYAQRDQRSHGDDGYKKQKHDKRDKHGKHYRKHDDDRYEAKEHHDRGRGAGPEHGFYKGDRLPYQYRGNIYVVNDWRGHRLSAPPRGYQWVQTGSDYVLAAVATGIILQILLN
jgi:Ni/Co efflux regulator RcnB